MSGGENPAVERLVAQRTTYQTDHGIGPLDRCTHSVRITDFTLDHLQLLVGQGHLARSSCKRPDSVPGFKQQRHDFHACVASGAKNDVQLGVCRCHVAAIPVARLCNLRPALGECPQLDRHRPLTARSRSAARDPKPRSR